jgi:hypothetical protein
VVSKFVSQHRINWCKVAVARRWQLPSCWCLLQNTCQPDESKEIEISGPYTANQTYDWLQCYRWNVQNHHPYSPDAVPSNFHQFRSLQKHMDSKQFTTDTDMKQAPLLHEVSCQTTPMSSTSKSELISQHKCLLI